VACAVKGVRFKTKKVGKPLYACPSGHVSRLATVVDREVEQAVMRRLANINPADYSADNPEVAVALQQIKELEEDLADWEAKALAGEVSASMFAKVEKDRHAKITALRPRTVVRHRSGLLSPEAWERGSLEERRAVARALIDFTVLPKGEQCIKPI
jgi:hypothetical protein